MLVDTFSGNFCLHAEPVLYRILTCALSCLKNTRFSPALGAALSLPSCELPRCVHVPCLLCGCVSEATVARWQHHYNSFSIPMSKAGHEHSLQQAQAHTDCLHRPLTGVSDEDMPELASWKLMQLLSFSELHL